MIGLDRATSGFSLSMGTGLAMETIFTPTDTVYDDTREFDKFDLNQVDVLMVSWYTIIRNLIQSLSATDRARVFETNKVKEIAAIANSELQVIEMLSGEAGVRLVVLAPDYYRDKFLLADMTKPTAKNMIYQIAVMSKGKIILNSVDKVIAKQNERLMLFSHIAMDLASAPQRQVVCLESNTGKVLRPPQFNKKFRKSVFDTSFMPLYPELLGIFGDSSGLLLTAATKDKRLTIEILQGGQVTTSTTRDRIKNLLRNNPTTKDILDAIKRR